VEKLEELAPAGAAVCSRVAVLRVRGTYRLLAAEPIGAGEAAFRIEGDETGRPSAYSVQVGEGLHVDLPPGTTLDEAADRFPWRFLNHSCDPNVLVRGRDVVALRPIGAYEEVAFDYDTTEHLMANPFACRCGAPSCRGRVAGFARLPRAEQVRLLPLLAPHLCRLLDGAAGAGLAPETDG
jgi:hypothetical protein